MNVAFTGNFHEEDSDVTLSDSEYKFKAKAHQFKLAEEKKPKLYS